MSSSSCAGATLGTAAKARKMKSSASSRLTALISAVILTLVSLTRSASAYQVAIDQDDQLRQTCSGMWAGSQTSIDLIFFKNSTGTVSTIFYEWQDFELLGKPGPDRDVFGDAIRTYICTPLAVTQGLCSQAEVGEFILAGNGTTIHKQRLDFGKAPGLTEIKTITYPVNQTGYYCVSAVPMTVDGEHTTFSGRAFFHNAFKGDLPGGEFPKLGFYFGLACLYILLGLGWGYLCVKHKDELLLVQHFVSGLFIILVVEQLITWVYYNYLNTHPIDYWRLASLENSASQTFAARALLVTESLLDSARNSASFFLLLIVAMGYGVVRPSIDPRLMLRVKALTAVHLVCGCLYSVGIVLLTIDAGGSWVFLFIFPLAFTLTTFMMWTLNSLNATIGYLGARKQTFKLVYFTRLFRILIAAVVIIFAFFVVSSIAFSQSGGENFPSQTWTWRWFLLDGWTSTLYLVVFSAVAWIWRPTGHNLRLSMSDEVATGDDPEGGDIELAGEYAGGPAHPDDSDDEDDEAAKRRATEARTNSHNSAQEPAPPYSQRTDDATNDRNEVMFSVGDEDEDDREDSVSRDQRSSRIGEGQGLMHGINASEETLMPDVAAKSSVKKD
ncbi:unnamed protein product [Sympodiomycopsis kandeliae]